MVVPGKLVQQIWRIEYVDIAELLKDNVEAERYRACRPVPTCCQPTRTHRW